MKLLRRGLGGRRAPRRIVRCPRPCRGAPPRWSRRKAAPAPGQRRHRSAREGGRRTPARRPPSCTPRLPINPSQPRPSPWCAGGPDRTTDGWTDG
eukprot:scaffold3841_cov412-Prasinococcus_capsulatus_cf.AAC.12